MTPLPVEESDLQPCLQKRPKTDQQTQLSSTTTNISALTLHLSGNTIPDSILGCTMNPDQLTENVNECSSSIKSTNGPPTLPLSSTDIYRTHIVSDPHKIGLYRNYQKARYQRTEFPTYFKQPTPSIRKFINLELVKKKRESKEERIAGMRDKLYGNVLRYVQQREPLRIEQIAEVNENGKLPRNILIEGNPGVGKTTLVWELCKGWGENRQLHKWDVVVLVQLRDIDAREASNLEQLLDPDEQFRSELDYIKRTNGNGVMIVFDGYDELSQKQKQRTSVFQRLLLGKLLPGATLLVTSRPSATRELPLEFREHLHQHIEVVDEDIDKYIKFQFCDNPDLLNDFQSYISSHTFVYKVMYIPLHCALVTDLYQTYWRKGKKEFAPKTFTQLYTCFIHSLLERYLDDHPVYEPQELNIQELTDLPRDVYDDLIKLAQLAAKGIEEQQYVFDNLTHNTLGLMQRVNDDESRKSKSVSYSFLHLTLQEYLAALYWSQLPPEEITHLFTESGVLPVKKYIEPVDSLFRQTMIKFIVADSNIHWPALYFYAGITRVMGTPLESICHRTKGYTFSVNVVPDLLYLLFESQNPEYISTVLNDKQYKITIESRLVGYITGYCISHCFSAAKWRIETEQHLIQSIITGTSSSIGGMINGLYIDDVTDYSKCFQMLFQLEGYTKDLTYLRLSNFYKDNDCSCCDELAQLYRYYPKLQMLILIVKGLRLDFTPCFSSLHHMSRLKTLSLTGIVINDSCHIVCDQPKQMTCLELRFNDCDLISLSAEALLLNTPFHELHLHNISLNVQSSAALKQFIKENNNNYYSCRSLCLSGRLHCLNCTPDEEHFSSLFTRQLFEGISKSLYQLGLNKFELNKEQAIGLKQVLIQNTTLEVLQLQYSINSMDVAEVVAVGLQYNTGVTFLNLYHGEECKDGVIRTLLQGLSYNCCLKTLKLLGIELNIKDYHMLNVLLIRNQTLKELTICENVDHEKAQYLADSLVNCNLKEISVFDNGKMGQAGVKHLVYAVMNNYNTQMLMLPSDYQGNYSYHANKVIWESTDYCKLLLLL